MRMDRRITIITTTTDTIITPTIIDRRTRSSPASMAGLFGGDYSAARGAALL